MKDAFPADQPLSRFLLSMAMASNDIEHAMWKAAEANEQDRPEFNYWVRLVMGHFIEALDALAQWRNSSDQVREFLGSLPADGREALKDATAVPGKVGQQAINWARNHTFHYPTPSAQFESDEEVIRVLEAEADEEVRLARVDGRPERLRWEFADRAAVMVAMGKHAQEDAAVYRQQVVDLEEGAAAFVNFVHVALGKHMEPLAQQALEGDDTES